jgi:hypothetical protein
VFRLKVMDCVLITAFVGFVAFAPGFEISHW